MRATVGALIVLSLCTTRISRADADGRRPVKTMIETVSRMCDAVAEQPTAVTAAQRFGMHLHDEGPNMSVTFSPRDRHFVKGAAIRRWGTDLLSGIDVDVDPSITLSLGDLRDSFGPFEVLKREHPGDAPEFSAQHRPPKRERGCSLVVRLRSGTRTPTGTEAVEHISIARE
jgi:hypothetical protein